jgi:hypothetical protein
MLYEIIQGESLIDRAVSAYDVIKSGSHTSRFIAEARHLYYEIILVDPNIHELFTREAEAVKGVRDYFEAATVGSRDDDRSILLEADEIVNGARAADYGSAKESFGKIACIAQLILDEEEKETLKHEGITATICCKILIAVKLSRESHKHKRDNLVDLSGYAELLNRLHG